VQYYDDNKTHLKAYCSGRKLTILHNLNEARDDGMTLGSSSS